MPYWLRVDGKTRQSTTAGGHREKTSNQATMNPNPYPAGRWSRWTGSTHARGKKARCGDRIPSESVAALRQAPLRELFWAAEDSGLVEDARLRIEAALASALAATPTPIAIDTETVAPLELQAACSGL